MPPASIRSTRSPRPVARGRSTDFWEGTGKDRSPSGPIELRAILAFDPGAVYCSLAVRRAARLAEPVQKQTVRNCRITTWK